MHELRDPVVDLPCQGVKPSRQPHHGDRDSVEAVDVAPLVNGIKFGLECRHGLGLVHALDKLDNVSLLLVGRLQLLDHVGLRAEKVRLRLSDDGLAVCEGLLDLLLRPLDLPFLDGDLARLDLEHPECVGEADLGRSDLGLRHLIEALHRVGLRYLTMDQLANLLLGLRAGLHHLHSGHCAAR